MKPRTILRNAAQAAIAAFGQLVLEEAGRWAIQELKRRKGRRGGVTPNTLVPLIRAAAQFLEEQWEQIAAAAASATDGRARKRRPGAGARGTDDAVARDDGRHARGADRDDEGRDRKKGRKKKKGKKRKNA